MPAGLTDTEMTMMAEVREVMQKYGAEVRQFALALEHSHFETSPGEVLHETNDRDSRVLTIRVVQEAALPATAKPTQWSLASGEPVVTQWCCADD